MELEIQATIKDNNPIIPTLLAIRTGEKEVSVWCPYCRRFHYHGLGHSQKATIPRNGHLGHRVEHCSSISTKDSKYAKNPLAETGYYLQLISKKVLMEAIKMMGNGIK